MLLLLPLWLPGLGRVAGDICRQVAELKVRPVVVVDAAAEPCTCTASLLLLTLLTSSVWAELG